MTKGKWGDEYANYFKSPEVADILGYVLNFINMLYVDDLILFLQLAVTDNYIKMNGSLLV